MLCGGLGPADPSPVSELTATGRYSTALRGALGQSVQAAASFSYGQHRIPKEAHPPLRARASSRTANTPRRSRPTSVAWRLSPRRATARPPRPSTVASCARSTRPSSAARCIATPARVRSPARHVLPPASPRRLSPVTPLAIGLPATQACPHRARTAACATRSTALPRACRVPDRRSGRARRAAARARCGPRRR